MESDDESEGNKEVGEIPTAPREERVLTNKIDTEPTPKKKKRKSKDKLNPAQRLWLWRKQLEAMKINTLPTPKQSVLLTKYQKAKRKTKTIVNNDAFVSERNPWIASLYTNEYIEKRRW